MTSREVINPPKKPLVYQRLNRVPAKEHLIVVDQNLGIRGIYNETLPLDISHLITDAQTLLQEN